MQISLWVPYDEWRARRLIKFMLRPTVTWMRVLGAVIAAYVVLALLVSSISPSIPLIVLGVFCVFGFEPLMVWYSLRAQNAAIRQGYHLVVDDAGVTMKAESYESRLAWSTIQRVKEKPDAWFLVLSKMQAMAIYKDLMTEEQRSQFAAILAQRQPA
ncbi:YcxB family protein [Saccharothrix coeruleofusca]|uniref:YcxB family protein n=1 Tax=Saccharothrix coeruleofusca TaxID=33919 RepID=UPI00167124B6|nr:YcxB family protein [Saccharothrix coeruleofusca]